MHVRFPSSLRLSFFLLLGLPLFFLGGPSYHSSRSFAHLWNLGHILYFALFTRWLHLALVKRLATAIPAKKILILLLVIPFLIGLALEISQFLVTGRNPDIFDLLRNELGVALALAFAQQPLGLFLSKNWRRIIKGTVFVVLLATASPLVFALVDESLAVEKFPILSDFESSLELSRWMNPAQLQEETKIVRHGTQAARVQLSTNKYSGVSLFHFPGDWRGFSMLHFSVYNPLAFPLALNCRIHDTKHKLHGSLYHDRFNTIFELTPGWNDLAVSLKEVEDAPKERKMDMRHIEGFGLFVVQQKEPLSIVLDYVYLR